MLRPSFLSLRVPCSSAHRTVDARWLSTIPDAGTSPSIPRHKPGPSLSPESLWWHWDTIAPVPEQLKYAETFFTTHPPVFLWSSPKFATTPFGDSPEVCFLGRSNVGKSSLLNALLGRKAMAHVSSTPGRTQSMNAFAVGGKDGHGHNRLVVLDMPGYGKGGRAEWGTEITKYLSKRKELKRAFLLIDTNHGVKKSDEQLLALFQQERIPYQIVLSKVDRLLFPTSRTPSAKSMENSLSKLRSTMQTVQDVVQDDGADETSAVGQVMACSSEKTVDGRKLGINAVRHAMLEAAGMELKYTRKMPQQSQIVSFEDIARRQEAMVS